MNLVVDFGNTNAKVGIFNGKALLEKHTFTSEEEVKVFLNSVHADHVLVSSVRTFSQPVGEWPHADRIVTLHAGLPLPIKSLYATPSTLGVDRIAAACGAHVLFPGVNALVIDAGSCITYEFIDAKAQYHGGAISPGLQMRFQAVHTFTAKLPLVKPAAAPLTGNSTETCIQSGVVNGMVAEIDGLISQYQAQYPDLKVILCGGDAGFFENKLKASIFASPDLVLLGLNSILIYNVSL